MGIRKPPNLLVQPVRVINISVKESSYGLLVPRVNKKNNPKVISRVPIRFNWAEESIDSFDFELIVQKKTES